MAATFFAEKRPFHFESPGLPWALAHSAFTIASLHTFATSSTRSRILQLRLLKNSRLRATLS